MATIVWTSGSTYRKAGARMLIERDGRMTGLLSGGCLEQNLREHARHVLTTATSKIVEYDMRHDDDLIFGIGAGCEGAMRILIEPLAPDSPAAEALRAAGSLVEGGEPAVLAAVHKGVPAELGTWAWPAAGRTLLDTAFADGCASAVATGSSRPLRWRDAAVVKEAWIQFLAPPPRILVCGAGPDAEPLVAQLRALRFAVTVVDHRPAFADPTHFPGATVSLGPAAELAERVALEHYFAAVVMSHHLASDAAYLVVLAPSSVPHVGLLGPRTRRERLLAELGPIAERLAPRLHAPVGLDIGAVTPEGIALAIAAQLHTLAAEGGLRGAHPVLFENSDALTPRLARRNSAHLRGVIDG